MQSSDTLFRKYRKDQVAFAKDILTSGDRKNVGLYGNQNPNPCETPIMSAPKQQDLKTNVLKVLDKIRNRVENPEYDEAVDEWADSLDAMLNDMRHNDQFGPEASTDPRGDFREGNWTIWQMMEK